MLGVGTAKFNLGTLPSLPINYYTLIILFYI